MGLKNHIIRNVLGSIVFHLQREDGGNNSRFKVIKSNKKEFIESDEILELIHLNEKEVLNKSNQGMGLINSSRDIK